MRTLKRRRRERKTDYKARLNLLKSPLPRIIVRKTNNYIIAQCVNTKEAQDNVLTGVVSKELLKYGWPKEKQGSLKSIPACYLTGLCLGEKIKKLNDKKTKENIILDIGLTRNIPKNRIYAVLKGLVDSGIKMKQKEDVFPDEKRIKGEHLKEKINFEDIRKKILG